MSDEDREAHVAKYKRGGPAGRPGGGVGETDESRIVPMGEKHTVRLEPVGIEFEVDEDETVLAGAFRQGLMLMHGCKEGQCSACKSFLLDGEVDLDRYSTFALPDFELEEGWTLLCRAHALEDLEVELINFDEEILRSGVPVQEGTARVDAIEPLTHDIRRLVLSLGEPAELDFHPGQYVDITIPGSDDGPPVVLDGQPALGQGPAGVHDQALPRRALLGPAGRRPLGGDELQIKGPYGVFTLRDQSPRRLLFIGGGAGMAPILCLLRSLVERASTAPPPTTTAPARRPTCSTARSSRRWSPSCRLPLRPRRSRRATGTASRA
jgi:propane monooxygenase reductase subunit